MAVSFEMTPTSRVRSTKIRLRSHHSLRSICFMRESSALAGKAAVSWWIHHSYSSLKAHESNIEPKSFLCLRFARLHRKFICSDGKMPFVMPVLRFSVTMEWSRARSSENSKQTFLPGVRKSSTNPDDAAACLLLCGPLSLELFPNHVAAQVLPGPCNRQIICICR